MATKIDFTDGLSIFEPDEKEFIKIKLSGAKITNEELEAKFGKDRLKSLIINSEIKRYLADQKIKEAENKNLVKKFNADKFVQLIPLAISVLAETMKNGSPSDKARVAMTISKPVLSYLERIGQVSAELDGLDKGEFEFKLAYKLPHEIDD